MKETIRYPAGGLQLLVGGELLMCSQSYDVSQLAGGEFKRTKLVCEFCFAL